MQGDILLFAPAKFEYITEKALDLLLDIVDWNNLVDLDGNDLITIGEVFDDKTIKSAVCEIMADKAVDYCLTTSAGIGRIIGSFYKSIFIFSSYDITPPFDVHAL